MSKDNIVMAVAGVLCFAIGVFKLVTVGISWDSFLILGGIILMVTGILPMINKKK